MKIKSLLSFSLICTFICGSAFAMAEMQQPESSSGVHKATVRVPVGSDGLTVEQRNVGMRLKLDNMPGSIKHLYVISAYSGQVLIYSTVQGKVTSSGKRLTPSILTGDAHVNGYGAFPVQIGGETYSTAEVLQDDGTYGTSTEYIFWWDTKGVYHQHYVSGGQIIHVSDQPIGVKSVVINMEDSIVSPPATK